MAQAAVAAVPLPIGEAEPRAARPARIRPRAAGLYGALLGVQEQAYQEATLARPSAGDLVPYVAEMACRRGGRQRGCGARPLARAP